MIINITHIGLALEPEVVEFNNKFVNHIYLRYRSLNQFANVEGEAIKYEMHEINTGLPPNEMIYVR